MEVVALIALAFALGGILKGATGAGAPILAVPVMAMFYDVPFAVTVFAIPNIVPNLWQGWAFRREMPETRFVLLLALSGAAGAVVGAVLLANLPSTLLSLLVAFAVLAYIAIRLLRSDAVLAFRRALALVVPVGVVAGILQGASGVSAPVSITFLNAMRLERGQFISTISVFFVAIALVQIPMLTAYGFLTLEMLGLSTLALVPLILFMPVGAFLVRHISARNFDRLILVLLLGLAVKLIVEAVI